MTSTPKDKKPKTTLQDDDIVSSRTETRRSFLTLTGVAAGLAAVGVVGTSQRASAEWAKYDPYVSDNDPSDPYGRGSDYDPYDPAGGASDQDQVYLSDPAGAARSDSDPSDPVPQSDSD